MGMFRSLSVTSNDTGALARRCDSSSVLCRRSATDLRTHGVIKANT